jgi:hypothetical protein
MYCDGVSNAGDKYRAETTYVCDLLHDGLHALKRVLADLVHLVGELRVLAPLPLLVGLVFRHLLLLLLDVLQKSDFSDLIAVVVDDVAVVVNFETGAVAKIASSETTKNITVLIAHLTLLVDTHARHWVNATLLLFRLPSLGLTDNVAVLVVDVAILVDLVASEALEITFDDATNDLTILGLNGTILGNLVVLEASERSLGLGILTLGKLSTSDDVAFVVPDLTLTINLLANHSGRVAFSNAAKDLAGGVDNVASLVDGATSEAAEVSLWLFFLLVWFSMALYVAIPVDDVAVFVDLVADELLRVAFGNLANAIAIVVFDESILDHTETLVALERTTLLLGSLVLRDKLAAANDVAGVVVNLTFAIRLTASKIRQVTLSKAANRSTVAVDEQTLLVECESVEYRKVIGSSLRLVLEGLSVAFNVAVLVQDVTILIHCVANQALGVALDDLADDVLVLISNLAIGDDAETFETSERSLGLALTLIFGDEFNASNDLAGIVPDLALVVQLPASKLFGVAFNQTSDGYALIADDIALLVDGLALEHGEVEGLFLFGLLLLGLLVALGVANN